LPSAKVILASQIIRAAAEKGVDFYCLTDRSQYSRPFLNRLECSLKRTLLTPKAAVDLLFVVTSDFLLRQIQNCLMTSHG
jgi:hypothetical protein